MTEKLIQLPNPDEVFSKWLYEASDKLLAKRYKKYASKSISVSAGETIKEVEPTIFVMINIEEKPATISKENKKIIPIKELHRYEFWEFDRPIEKEEWGNNPPTVLLWKNIKALNCSICGGKGYHSCDCTSKGLTQCNKCKGGQMINCPDCGVKGVFIEKIEVKHGNTGKKKKKFQICNTIVLYVLVRSNYLVQIVVGAGK